MKTCIEFFAAVLLLATAGSALAEVHYVDVNSTNATPPYTNWTTAATNIQDAVDAAVSGDEVVVANGTYTSVVVNKSLNLRSVNGASFTTINGGRPCAYLTNTASLSGFSLAGGSRGGAVGGTLNNCRLTGNLVVLRSGIIGGSGGGASGCTLNYCTLDSNAAGEGGGAADCTLNYCTLSGNSALVTYDPAHLFSAYGGGAAGCSLNNCELSGNSASYSYDSAGAAYGGGAYDCTLNNCTLSGNSTRPGPGPSGGSAYGGGAYGGTLNNCTLSGNSARAPDSVGADGGGAYRSTLNNCILFNNTHQGICEDCNSPGWVSGGNWIGDPLFVANLRLQSNSPCINAGRNAFAPAGPDLDGNPRISGGTVDMGAYEFQAPVSIISYVWLQQFNLPISPLTDNSDPDGDGVDDYHEWLAGTNPTNRFSSPAQLTIIPSGTNVILTWPTNAVGFTLQSTTNLDSPAVWSTNASAPVVIAGQNTVTNPITGPQRFYRLVQ